MPEKKPFLCRIGLHDQYNNTYGVNFGSDENPVYFMRTERRCNRCEWCYPPRNCSEESK